MATKQEILASINSGIERVNATFGNLSEEQLQLKVHEGERGWTAKEVLVHLADRQTAYDITFGLADGTVEVPSAEDDFVDDFNRNLINARIGNSRDALLEEFNSVHQSFIARVNDTNDGMLAMEIETPIGRMSFGDVLILSSGAHAVRHTQEVEQALGLDGPPRRTA